MGCHQGGGSGIELCRLKEKWGCSNGSGEGFPDKVTASKSEGLVGGVLHGSGLARDVPCMDPGWLGMFTAWFRAGRECAWIGAARTPEVLIQGRMAGWGWGAGIGGNTQRTGVFRAEYK